MGMSIAIAQLRTTDLAGSIRDHLFHLKLVEKKDPSIDFVQKDVHDAPWGRKEFAGRDEPGHTLYFGQAR